MKKENDMMSDIKIVEQPSQPLAMNAKKFALWLFIITVVMIFAALTSAYIVRQAEGNWTYYELPVEMFYTTGILLLSSITMHWSYHAARKDELGQVKTAISITAVLGVLFLIGQVYVWSELVAIKAYFSDPANPASSFIYILTGLHGIHLISGLIFILIVLVSTFRYKVHSKNLNQIQMCATYWHFLDALWVYLFLFLLFYR